MNKKSINWQTVWIAVGSLCALAAIVWPINLELVAIVKTTDRLPELEAKVNQVADDQSQIRGDIATIKADVNRLNLKEGFGYGTVSNFTARYMKDEGGL